MRLDGVEVKTTLEAEQVAPALDALRLGDESPLTIWFYDDLTTGSELSLLDAGLAIRIRAKDPIGGDCTVKLRPCRRSQFTSKWLATESTGKLDFRLEEDWAGDRRVLAASAQCDVTDDVITFAKTRNELPADALSKQQRAYLAECATIRVNPDALVRLGPITARRWKKVGATPCTGLDVRAERWTVGDLDFLELSLKVSAEQAQSAADALTAALTELAVTPDSNQETKTRRVLKYLAERAQSSV